MLPLVTCIVLTPESLLTSSRFEVLFTRARTTITGLHPLCIPERRATGPKIGVRRDPQPRPTLK